jgi:hypothetical protein
MFILHRFDNFWRPTRTAYSNQLGHIIVESKKPISQRRSNLSVPPRTTKRRDARAEQKTPTGDATPPAKTVHINIHVGALPDIARLSPATLLAAIRRLSFAKKALIGAVVVGIIITGLSLQHHDATNTGVSDPNKVIENLEYQTVLPHDKSIDNLGGWKRVSPSGSEPVYAYVDSINGIPVSVSQQPLPNSFKSDIDGQVGELAKKFNATTKLDASGTNVYLGTSAKGPQSAILTKNGLLILIKSQGKIDDSAWIDYAKSLN